VIQNRLVQLQCTTLRQVIQPNDNQNQESNDKIIHADESFSSIIEWSKLKRKIKNNQIEMDSNQWTAFSL